MKKAITVSELVKQAREYTREQRAKGSILSPLITENSPGVILSRALRGARKIQES